jgi:hypothetical protein
MDYPFKETRIRPRVLLREFSQDTNEEELVWHQDQEDRKIKIIEANGWKLQMDNQLPILLEKNKSYDIPAYEFHRVIKGSGKLVVIIEKT